MPVAVTSYVQICLDKVILLGFGNMQILRQIYSVGDGVRFMFSVCSHPIVREDGPNSLVTGIS